MSFRVLRKLHGDKDLPEEISDPDNELPVTGGARRKQLNINRYDLLNQLSLSESEVKEDDNETEANNANDEDDFHETTKRRKKKKKKKSGKHVSSHRSSEDNTEMDEVERSVREVNRLLGDNYVSGSVQNSKVRMEKSVVVRNNILSIQHKHLNPNNELKRIFGSKIIQTEHKRKNRTGTSRGHWRTTWLVSAKDNWPPIGKFGLSMSLLETKQGIHYFAYEHSQSYRQTEHKFLDAVESLNPDNLVAIVNEHPYHIDALIQLSDLCRISEDLAMAADLTERALFALECAFHPIFNVAQGNCRLDYRRQENRAIFITLFKHLQFVGGRACYRTALELSKMLLSLDPDGDPLAVKLIIDFYALKSKEYKWLIEFSDEWESSKNLSQLPNFAFSLPVAYFHISEGDTEQADNLLQNALIMFPGVLRPLMDKCSICADSRVEKSNFFNITSKQPAALTQLINLYVSRNYHLWKEADMLPWLEKNVNLALDRVEKGEKIVVEYEQKRLKRYQGSMPLSISRHIILSDIKGVSPLTEDTSTPVLSFDPLPPPDSINIYNKSLKPKPSNPSTIGLFFRSLIPNFESLPRLPLPQEGEEEDGARALPEREGNNTSMVEDLASLAGVIRDLIGNLRLPDVPNDADVDENDDSEDDEPNYLT